MPILINNLPHDCDAAKLQTLLSDHDIPAPDEITIAAGLSGHPSALLDYHLSHAAQSAILNKLEGMIWDGRALDISYTQFFQD